jgi:DNA-directed RNA polymerase subunit beta
MHHTSREKKYFSKYKTPLAPIPNLLENQLESFDWFVREALKEVFKEFSPIGDYSGKKFELSFTSFVLGEPKFDERYAKANKLTYDGQLKARVKLVNKIIGETKEQEIFLVDLPLMTAHGTFIINGVERVMVPQLARSFGIFFTEEDVKGKKYFGGKIIPARGVWIDKEDFLFFGLADDFVDEFDSGLQLPIVSQLVGFGIAFVELWFTQDK